MNRQEILEHIRTKSGRTACSDAVVLAEAMDRAGIRPAHLLRVVRACLKADESGAMDLRDSDAQLLADLGMALESSAIRGFFEPFDDDYNPVDRARGDRPVSLRVVKRPKKEGE